MKIHKQLDVWIQSIIMQVQRVGALVGGLHKSLREQSK
jgi:hypothetical protein